MVKRLPKSYTADKHDNQKKKHTVLQICKNDMRWLEVVYPNGVVYLMKDTKFLKIGKTHDLVKRYKNFRRYNLTIHIVGLLNPRHYDTNLDDLESKILQSFIMFKIHGYKEWFFKRDEIIDYFTKHSLDPANYEKISKKP